MTNRRATLPLAAFAAISLLLASCSSGGSDTSATTVAPSTVANSTSAPSSSSTTGDGGPSTTAASPAATTATQGTGCTTGSAQIPAGAAQRQVVDVDGDGRPDTSWIHTVDATTTVGIATAAGGGSQIPYDSASPVSRSILVANADELGPVEIIISDGRGASLYAFVDCSIQPVRNVQGQTYQFDLENLRGHGTGIGCIQTSQGRRLAGLQAEDRTDTKVSWTSTVINLNGLKATNGIKRTGSYTLPAEKVKADLLDQITCGDLTMAANGVTEQE